MDPHTLSGKGSNAEKVERKEKKKITSSRVDRLSFKVRAPLEESTIRKPEKNKIVMEKIYGITKS